jgi:hypothetical protein
MKNVMMVAALSLISLSAFAQNRSSMNDQLTTEYTYGGGEIECSDPRTMGRYNTRQEAEQGCPKFDNIYVSYDWGYRKYICDCTAPEHGGGN